MKGQDPIIGLIAEEQHYLDLHKAELDQAEALARDARGGRGYTVDRETNPLFAEADAWMGLAMQIAEEINAAVPSTLESAIALLERVNDEGAESYREAIENVLRFLYDFARRQRAIDS